MAPSTTTPIKPAIAVVLAAAPDEACVVDAAELVAEAAAADADADALVEVVMPDVAELEVAELEVAEPDVEVVPAELSLADTAELIEDDRLDSTEEAEAVALLSALLADGAMLDEPEMTPMDNDDVAVVAEPVALAVVCAIVLDGAPRVTMEVDDATVLSESMTKKGV